MPAPIVFFDIASLDSEALQTFYSRLFGWESDGAGQFAVNVDVPLRAAFRQDSAQKRLYIGVNDVTLKLKEIEASGGSIDVPRFEVPGVVALGLFRDPAGNPMGLVELEEGKPKIP